jgi:hypothetical protein
MKRVNIPISLKVEITDLAKDQLILGGFYASGEIRFRLESDGVGTEDTAYILTYLIHLRGYSGQSEN